MMLLRILARPQFTVFHLTRARDDRTVEYEYLFGCCRRGLMRVTMCLANETL